MVAAAARVWRRRDKPWPLYKAWTAKRQKLTADQVHNDLVANVLKRSAVTGVRVPVDFSGHNPVTVVWHPDDYTTHQYPSHQSYMRAGNSGTFSPLRSSTGSPPVPVQRKTDVELHEWLDAHHGCRGTVRACAGGR